MGASFETLWRPCFLAKCSTRPRNDTTQIPAVWRQLHTALLPQEAGPSDPGPGSVQLRGSVPLLTPLSCTRVSVWLQDSPSFTTPSR